ncbi:MAG: translation elongation factor Ts [Nitrospirae bacterium]|nr:translation elongation factor Ts [Nitrospirota bacterium]
MAQTSEVDLIRQLREKTGAGIMECKKAIAEATGDLDKAVRVLREKGLARADRKAQRVAAEGLVCSYVHAGGRIGVLVELNCETDFVARTPEFQELAKELAMQVAASNPAWVSREDVPAARIEDERQILRKEAASTGKPPHVAEKIAEGKLEKFCQAVCLLDQLYIRDPNVSVKDLIKQHIARIGENIVVRRFIRFELGETKPAA